MRRAKLLRTAKALCAMVGLLYATGQGQSPKSSQLRLKDAHVLEKK